jgi:hypothetical protein
MATKTLNKLVRDLGSTLSMLQQPRSGKAQSRAQNARKKPSRKSRKLSRAAKRDSGVSLQGSSRMFESAQPVAVDCILKNPVYIRVSGKVSHPDFGDGVRIEGRQLLADITTTATDFQLFGTAGTATASGVNLIYLSPDALNGRLALQARNYSRYAFRKVKIHYIPRVATTDVGQMVMAYSTDGASAAYSTQSFANLTAQAPNMVTPFRKESMFEIGYTGDLTWMTELDASSNSTIRQTVQGSLIGLPDATSIGAILHGWTWVEYVVDLYGQNVDYGFTVELKSQEEKDAVKAYLSRRLRIAEEASDTWSDCESVSGRAIKKR